MFLGEIIILTICSKIWLFPEMAGLYGWFIRENEKKSHG
jgi:hypothetical protein